MLRKALRTVLGSAGMEELFRNGEGFANLCGWGLFAERTDSEDMNRHTDRQGSANRPRVISQRCASQTEATLQQAKAL